MNKMCDKCDRAFAEYMKTVEPVREEWDKIVQPAMVEFLKTTRDANRVIKQAETKYRETVEPFKAKLQQVESSAWSKYLEIKRANHSRKVEE